jgi:hypothetical protein
MTRLLLGAIVGIVLLMAIPSTSAGAAGHGCRGFTSPATLYEVRNMRVGGRTTCAGGRGVIANWAQNCSAAHCIVGAYGCHARIISRISDVSRLYCFARGRFVIATFLRP